LFYGLNALPAAEPTASKHWEFLTSRKDMKIPVVLLKNMGVVVRRMIAKIFGLLSILS